MKTKDAIKYLTDMAGEGSWLSKHCGDAVREVLGRLRAVEIEAAHVPELRDEITQLQTALTIKNGIIEQLKERQGPSDLSDAVQLAFELGGLEDGSYHLEIDELEQVIKRAVELGTTPAPARQVPEGMMLVPESTEEWPAQEAFQRFQVLRQLSLDERSSFFDAVITLRDKLAAAPKAEQDNLDQRMKDAGMLSVTQLLAGTPLDSFIRHAGVKDLDTFAEWLEMRRAECLKLVARYDLGERKKDDGLYEWAIAHSAVLSEVHVNFKAARAQQAEPDKGGVVA